MLADRLLRLLKLGNHRFFRELEETFGLNPDILRFVKVRKDAYPRTQAPHKYNSTLSKINMMDRAECGLFFAFYVVCVHTSQGPALIDYFGSCWQAHWFFHIGAVASFGTFSCLLIWLGLWACCFSFLSS
jgi:hypothetical protein